MKDNERYIHLGPSPKDNVTSERYAEALDELRDFTASKMVVSSLENLSDATLGVRRALRDVVVSVGTFYLPPEVSICDPENLGQIAKTRIPGTFTFSRQIDGESVYASVDMLGQEDHLHLARTVFTDIDWRNSEERKQILAMLMSFFPQLEDSVKDELRGYEVVNDIDQAIDLAYMDKLKQRTSDVGDLGEAGNIKLHKRPAEAIAQGVLRKLVTAVERGQGLPRRTVEMHLPVYKDLAVCNKTEVSLLNCLDDTVVSCPTDFPGDSEVQQRFLVTFQEVVQRLLSNFPEPYALNE